ncbi:MAG: Gfo/Idh/MocA family oxidoreductase [Clostridia bacterium]|nr:Gfo/Idh/MocA family oxidoreductase [Clostridia bacterium]MBO5207241.1 Gfo/Idh/MocA family oxidoreductase [Clostridia bacterium]
MKEFKIAMLGMVDGNGHPYSWSAMFNGYNKDEMENCPFPVIPRYLEKEPAESFGVRGAKITHVWCDDPEDAKKVAAASLIPNIVEKPEDVIGEVDAVIVATDKGWEHVWRCKPFIDAGLPIFIDKPLADNVDDLNQFIKWYKAGHRIMSSSSLRYTKEYIPYMISTHELGELRYINMTMPKSWERYGIHALEPVFCITGPGYVSVRNTGSKNNNILHLKHKDGIDVNLAVIYDCAGSPLKIMGTKGSVSVPSADSYYSFHKQLDVFVEYLETDVRPYPFEDTIELMMIIIAGIRSREEGGREVTLDEIRRELVL